MNGSTSFQMEKKMVGAAHPGEHAGQHLWAGGLGISYAPAEQQACLPTRARSARHPAGGGGGGGMDQAAPQTSIAYKNHISPALTINHEHGPHALRKVLGQHLEGGAQRGSVQVLHLQACGQGW